jgi:hypothetical protein
VTSTHRRIVLAVVLTALTIGTIAGLLWIAPMEYGTGRYLGLGVQHAAVIPALVDSYVALSLVVGRDRRWSLPLAGVSGLVGQLHAADLLPPSDHVRYGVAALAVALAVVVVARLKLLSTAILAYLKAMAEGETAAVRAAELAERQAAAVAERDRLAAAEMAERVAKAKAERQAAEATAERAATATPTDTRPAKRTAKPQAKRHVHPGLTEADMDVLTAMLGQGEMGRAAIVLASGRPEGTVKVALSKLVRLGHVEAVEGRRGHYLAVEPTVTESAEAVNR